MALKADILSSYPPVNEKAVDELLAKEIAGSNKKIVVLDDDPTGVQTVHDISVYTNWSEDSIRKGFAEENKLFYILTNSRGFTAAQTEIAHREIAKAVDAVSKETGKSTFSSAAAIPHCGDIIRWRLLSSRKNTKKTREIR